MMMLRSLHVGSHELLDVENHNGTGGLAALKQLSVIIEAPKIDVVRKSKYIVKHVDLFYALCEVDDWDFISFPDEQQEELMKALTVKVFAPGENIIVEGDAGGDLFIVSATEETADLEEVEVVNGNILAGTEVFLTKLQRGQFFGQKYFLTRRAVGWRITCPICMPASIALFLIDASLLLIFALQNKRGATVRVPKDSKVSSVRVAVLTPENFEKWDSFRNLLLVKSVPMIQMLPRKERQKITQELVIREFKDGEYIIRQGDHGKLMLAINQLSPYCTSMLFIITSCTSQHKHALHHHILHITSSHTGEDFYIIQDGSVHVTEKRPHLDHGWEEPQEHVLVTLREGKAKGSYM
jgi:CRP-like cAMP-binding protein